MKQKREELKKNPKKNQKGIHLLAPHGDFPCLSKGTVIQDALHLKCAICGNWHLIRGLKHRQKKMVCQGFLDTNPFFQLFGRSHVIPCWEHSATFFKTGLGTPHTQVYVVFGCFERAESFTVTSADIPEGHIEPFV